MDGQKMSRQPLLTLLAELGAAPGEWISVYLRPESVADRTSRPVLESLVEPLLVAAASSIDDESLQKAASRLRTGIVLFHNAGSTVAIVPPFPVTQDDVHKGPPHVQPLQELLARPRRLVLVLITWNAYVMALYDNETLIRHKKGTGHIHAPHKKGGSSQARFARRTENQRAEFLRRIAGHIDLQFGQESVDHVFFGGNRLILKPLTQESRFLRDRARLLAHTNLLVKRATLDTVQGAFTDACSAIVFRR